MDEQAYTALFTDLAYYFLPDGTLAQAQWDGLTWLLIPENPVDPKVWYMQYEVYHNGQIIAVQHTDWYEAQRHGEPVKVELFKHWPTDLSVEDFRPVKDRDQ